MKRVTILSKSNSIILNSINEYKINYDFKCNEGYINEFGLVTGINGKIVNVSRSYSNMKGIGYKDSLIEYDIDKCVTSADNNTDRYILSGNPNKNSISIVIDITTEQYIKQMINIFDKLNVEYNLLINNTLEKYLEYENILFKGNNNDDFKSFYKFKKDFYCVKYNDFDVLDTCSEYDINSIYMKDIINKDLLLNIKKSLNKGDIVFIKENKYNLNELSSTVKYIKGLGIDIVSIKKLVS